MKYLFADSLDVVDPNYDFLAERSLPGRQRQHEEQYPHEILSRTPYDGILVSRAMMYPGGKYSPAQTMRFRREGGRAFFRLQNDPKFQNMMLMGDNGAFAYSDKEEPPYSVEDTLEFYSDSRFDHGCSLDHIIFDYFPDNRPLKEVSKAAQKRYELTLNNAEKFLKLSPQVGNNFVPLGAVQGWSPASKAEAALKLQGMGYDYLAIGGLVPLKTSQIHDCLKVIRETISPKTRLHLLGFARAESIHEFLQYDIASFDSTSPLIKAFKDATKNYYARKPDGGLEYFTAVRVPQASDNPHLKQAVRKGLLNLENLQEKEILALKRLREYDKNSVNLESTIEAVIDYNQYLIFDAKKTTEQNDAAIATTRASIERTLRAQPWKDCACEICRDASIEVIIFRGSNRNKRRGMHNLSAYYDHLQITLGNGS